MTIYIIDAENGIQKQTVASYEEARKKFPHFFKTKEEAQKAYGKTCMVCDGAF